MDEITKYDAALALIDGRGLAAFGGEPLAAALLDAARAKAEKQVLGDGPRWLAAAATLERLGADARVEGAPAASDDEISVKERRAPRLGPAATAVEQDPEARARAAVVKARLLELSPWRKGPFEVLGVTVDAEWRCDKKWARVMNAVNVAGKTVLDVGCGNGYYLLRALGAGARAALGIDPTWLYVAQFGALRRVENPLGVAAPPLPAWVLPLGLEDLPAAPLPAADVVFSMGVLYHRKSPLEHLEALREVVKPGGTLVLETLVVPGDERTVLVPRDRYAAMRNVWMLPSVEAAAAWLRRTGYADVRIVDVTATSTEEQRATEFMASASLAQFLDPADSGLTVEGYPAPTRAILVARRP